MLTNQILTESLYHLHLCVLGSILHPRFLPDDFSLELRVIRDVQERYAAQFCKVCYPSKAILIQTECFQVTGETCEINCTDEGIIADVKQ
mmetsp:Transcript_36385/g.57032  ORF Transcript_36385/g.57032 Transcript_36385/m.57032 type:complete len:90 (+) Transcript_36385:355-624(+)